MTDERPAVRLRDVSKRYGRGRQVLTGVDLDVRRADILAMTGGNGSGKSTLLRILAGLSAPSSGQVARAAGVVGYVPERFPSHDRMSASAYLRHMGRVRGLTTPEAGRRADDLLDRLALTGGAGTPMRKLSKGNAQKVALAQALLVPPGLLVLDEPWSGLDSSVHGVLGELMREAAGQGAAVVFTDHHESVVTSKATSVCRIDGGRLTGPGSKHSKHEAMLVTLAETSGGTPLAWRERPGVLSAVERDGAVELLVARDSHDALLVEAVTHGWSVTGVHPAPATHRTSR